MTDYSQADKVKLKLPKIPKLVTFPSKGNRPIIEWEYSEFQCLCPISGRHDQGVVMIKYLPDKKILESKSVRDYLALWRNVKVWQEYVTEELAEVLYTSCKPKWLMVEIKWSGRGGIFAKTCSKRGKCNNI
jgi:7-cyano-7-deazaguanine reductase